MVVAFCSKIFLLILTTTIFVSVIFDSIDLMTVSKIFKLNGILSLDELFLHSVISLAATYFVYQDLSKLERQSCYVTENCLEIKTGTKARSKIKITKIKGFKVIGPHIPPIRDPSGNLMYLLAIDPKRTSLWSPNIVKIGSLEELMSIAKNIQKNTGKPILIKSD